MINKRLASLLSVTTSFTLLMLSGIFGASRANAVSVTSSNGVATGINDLNVSGQQYDVDFTYGTFADVFGNPFTPGWTPPNFSGFQGQINPNTIQNAANAVKTQLNAGSTNQVAGGNPLTPKNYFISGGLVDRVADTIQLFYGEQNSANQWVSKDLTCTYDPGNKSVQNCVTAYISNFEPTFNPANLRTREDLFTKPQAMFAKYTPESVPEPITILGTIVAGGMGVAIKRKQKNKTAA